MSRIVTITRMDATHQYDKDGNAITTWNSKYCGWVINKEYENCIIDWVEDKNGITEFPRGGTKAYFEKLYPGADNNPVITVTWYWDQKGYKKFFKENLETLATSHSQTWEYLDYTEEEAINMLGSYCRFNEEAYRTVIKYNNKTIFDGKL